MSNETSNYQNTGFSSEANVPNNEANASNTMGNVSGESQSKLKEYGKKSLAPLIDLVHKYKGELDPYFVAIGKGLDGAVNAFNEGSTTNSSTSSSSSQIGGISSDSTLSADSSISDSSISGDISSRSSGSDSSAERVVAGWFREASDWFSGAREKLKSNDAKDLLNYLEEQSAKHPGLMFSSSYLVGVAMGRFGRHLTRQKMNSSSTQTGEFSSQSDGFGGESNDVLKH